MWYNCRYWGDPVDLDFSDVNTDVDNNTGCVGYIDGLVDSDIFDVHTGIWFDNKDCVWNSKELINSDIVVDADVWFDSGIWVNNS